MSKPTVDCCGRRVDLSGWYFICEGEAQAGNATSLVQNAIDAAYEAGKAEGAVKAVEDTAKMLERDVRAIVREELDKRQAAPVYVVNYDGPVFRTGELRNVTTGTPTPHPAGEPYKVVYEASPQSSGVEGPDGRGSEYVMTHDRPAIAARLNRAFQLGWDACGRKLSKKEGR